MADNDPVSIYQTISSLQNEVHSTWQGGLFGTWSVNLNIFCYRLSCQPPAEAELDDWYLLQIQGDTFLETGTSSWRLAGHEIMLVMDQSSGAVLIDHAPTTTIESSTYSTSMSTTISGSIGFFGSDPTATGSYSVTTSNSFSRTTPDLSIIDYANMDMPNVPNWIFAVKDGSLIQTSDCPLSAGALFRVKHGAPSVDYSIGFSAYLEGGDTQELLDLAMNTSDPQIIAGFADAIPMDFLHGKARLMRSQSFTLQAPPAPVKPKSA